MLKKLAGAVIVAAFAFAGMAASAAVAVRMTRAEASTAPRAAAPVAVLPARGAKPKRATAPRAPHPWNESCAAADSEAQLLIATMSYDDPQEFLRLAREGIGINVRLYKGLRSAGGGGATGRAFLARLERGIADDTQGLAQLQQTMSRAQLKHWAEVSAEGNATLTRLAKKLGAPACVDYFNG